MAGALLGLIELGLEQGIDPGPVFFQVAHFGGHFADVGVDQCIDEPFGTGGVLLLDNGMTNAPCRHADDSEHGRHDAGSNAMHSSGLSHHLPLRPGPVLPVGRPADVEEFPQRGEMTILRLDVPQRRPVGQSQFGPALASFTLFAGQPFPQRRHEVIVRELVISGAGFNPGHGILRCLFAFGVGRRDEADFAVENADQVVEVLRAVGVAGRRQ